MNRERVVPVIKEIAKWIPTLMLVFVFGAQGFAKFSDTSGWAAAFRHWGYPDWFRFTIGGVEMAAAALLLWRRTAPIGALAILVVMSGGMATHVFFDHGRHISSEVGPMIFALIVLLARRDQLRLLHSAAMHSISTRAPSARPFAPAADRAGGL